jgi:hypothetical protein
MTSIITGKTHTRMYEMTVNQINAYTSARRPLIHQIFPMMSAEDREFLMTGITPEEWAAAFPKVEEEEDNEDL